MNAYPLSWPIGWERVPANRRERARFGRRGSAGQFGYRPLQQITIAFAVDTLLEELRKLGAALHTVVISTNLRYKVDGTPYSNQKDPDDVGAAVYFSLDGKPVALACDKWDRVADNIYAMACHVDALRGIDRWGVGKIERAFTGYAALPAPAAADAWWVVLGIPSQRASADEINAAWKRLMRTAHPDAGGTVDQAARINAARDEGLKAVGA